MSDRIKWISVVFIFISAILFNIYYKMDISYLNSSLLIASFILIAIIAFSTNQGRTIFHFMQDAKAEARKIFWPTRYDTLRSTGVVILMVIFLSLILWLFDAALLKLTVMLTGQGEY